MARRRRPSVTDGHRREKVGVWLSLVATVVAAVTAFFAWQATDATRSQATLAREAAAAQIRPIVIPYTGKIVVRVSERTFLFQALVGPEGPGYAHLCCVDVFEPRDERIFEAPGPTAQAAGTTYLPSYVAGTPIRTDVSYEEPLTDPSTKTLARYAQVDKGGLVIVVWYQDIVDLAKFRTIFEVFPQTNGTWSVMPTGLTRVLTGWSGH